MPAKEEEEETCGFCKFMKGGACKDVFVVSRRAAPCGAPEPSLRPRALGLTLFPSPRLDSTVSNHLATDATKAWEACVDSCRDKDGGDFVENCLNQVRPPGRGGSG